MTSSRNGDIARVNAALDLEMAHKWASTIEDAAAVRLGVKVEEARPDVARKLGVAPGTLENLRRLRTKVIPNWMMMRLRSEFVAVLQSQIMRLEHEIHIARQTGASYRDDALASAEAQVVKAKALLTEGSDASRDH